LQLPTAHILISRTVIAQPTMNSYDLSSVNKHSKRQDRT